jgi:hypothetical protein
MKDIPLNMSLKIWVLQVVRFFEAKNEWKNSNELTMKKKPIAYKVSIAINTL